MILRSFLKIQTIQNRKVFFSFVVYLESIWNHLVKSYNDVIIAGRKRGNNKKKKDIDEEFIDDTNTRKLVGGKDVGKD